jgi:hypothetical protein
MKTLVLLALVGLAACGSKTKAAPSEPAAAETSAMPAGDTATPAAEPSKCVKEGGQCGNKLATNACKRFEEAPEWGCTEPQTGCCLNN